MTLWKIPIWKTDKLKKKVKEIYAFYAFNKNPDENTTAYIFKVFQYSNYFCTHILVTMTAQWNRYYLLKFHFVVERTETLIASMFKCYVGYIVINYYTPQENLVQSYYWIYLQLLFPLKCTLSIIKVFSKSEPVIFFMYTYI